MVLPHADIYGHVVFTQSMGLLDLSLPGASMERYQKVGYYLLHRGLQRPAAQTAGIALLIDFAGFSLVNMLRHVRRADVRRGVDMLQDCTPAHLDCIYLANTPAWAERLLAMVRPLLRKDSLQKKLIMLERGSLAAHFAPGALPKQAGGQLEYDWRAQIDEWVADEARRGPPPLDMSRWIAEGAKAEPVSGRGPSYTALKLYFALRSTVLYCTVQGTAGMEPPPPSVPKPDEGTL
eukprot:2500484-Prymnesium_polylepis.1